MNYFFATTLREAKRMSALRESYEKQLASLPKGSLRLKERNGRKYFYLAYRRDGKVVSEYVGNDESVVADLKERLERRKNIEKLLKSIKNELRLMNRALEVAR
ncbi:MAG: hypothetical protein ABFD25_11950 [Clostridiaceae bacterium]